MISIKQNPNFTQWFQVVAFGQFIDEVKGSANALRIAKSEAKRLDKSHVNFLGKVIKL